MSCRVRPRGRRGFTLVELLVVIILMILIIGVVANIFNTSREIISINEARITVYVNASYAMDRIMVDLFGALPWDGGAQRFVLHNFRIDSTDEGKDYYDEVSSGASEETGGHYLKGTIDGADYEAAADVLSFRSVTLAGDQVGSYQVTYYLKGDAEGGSRHKTWRTQRPIFTLMRRVTEASPAESTTDNWTRLPKIDLNLDGTPDTTIQEEEVCHYVLSFNIEYLARENGGQGGMNFSQLEASPCNWSDPLGDGDPPSGVSGNDTDDDGDPLTITDNPYRIPQVRITIVIVEDNGERSERMITHVFQIPMG